MLSGCTEPAGEPVHVLAPEGLLPEHLLLQFERDTGSQVMVDEYDYGESIKGALAGGDVKYDVVIAEQRYTESLRDYGLLVSGGFPYLANEIWLGRNPEFVPEPIESWKDLWLNEYAGRIGVLWDSREMIAVGLLAAGYNLNSTDPDALNRAGEMLARLAPNVNVKYSGYNLEQLYSGDLGLAMVHSGSLNILKSYGSAIKGDRPGEGVPGTVLYIAPVTNMEHRETAAKLAKFLLEPENLKMAALYSGSFIGTEPVLTMQTLPPEVMQVVEAIYKERFERVRQAYE